MEKPTWIIHLVCNGLCGCGCGKYEDSFCEGECNAHTHGLMEQFGHPDFQLVLNIDPNTIGGILNTLGIRVRNGEKFNAGDIVEDVIGDGYKVRLDAAVECDRIVLRVILPDEKHRFPEDDGCDSPYNMQTKWQAEKILEA